MDWLSHIQTINMKFQPRAEKTRSSLKVNNKLTRSKIYFEYVNIPPEDLISLRLDSLVSIIHRPTIASFPKITISNRKNGSSWAAPRPDQKCGLGTCLIS